MLDLVFGMTVQHPVEVLIRWFIIVWASHSSAVSPDK